jgi:tetratricopeptide (TPR) repeat protein
MKFAVPAIALFLSACSHLPMPGTHGWPGSSQPEAQTLYQQALVNYRESRFDAALADFDAAASSGNLKSEEEINARKHLAFIHCSNGRELPCREQFQAILKAEPKFALAANEASHPVWGPVWRSVKGAADEQRAVAKANGLLASGAQQMLAQGLKEYEEGKFKQAADTLQNALRSGLPGRTDETIAHKYSAFSYCLTQRRALCRAEFRKIFALDPGFQLLPAENGHPGWASSYRLEKSAASRGMKKTSAKK